MTTTDVGAHPNRRVLFRTRVKFCGMTRAGDVRLASQSSGCSPRPIGSRLPTMLRTIW